MTTTETFDSPRALLAELDPAADRWRPARHKGGWPQQVDPLRGTGWIFRGQAEAQWPLLPAAFREDATQIFGDLTVPEGSSDQELRRRRLTAQLDAEVRTVVEFIQLADSLGISTPISDATEAGLLDFQQALPTRDDGDGSGSEIAEMPPKDLKMAFALAQHHGIPTRLLDWSKDPRVALFFAVDGRAPEGRFAVWAFNTRLLTRHHPVRVFGGPYGHNQYLKAQGGVFTYDLGLDRVFLETGRWRRLEAALEGTGPGGEPVLVRMVGEGSWRDEILETLWLQGISRARLMPSLDKVAETMLDYRRLFGA